MVTSFCLKVRKVGDSRKMSLIAGSGYQQILDWWRDFAAKW